MDRRSFLGRIVSVGLALAAPAMPVMLECFTPRPSRRLASLSKIMEGQAQFWHGNEQPTLILMSPRTFSETLGLIPLQQRFFRQSLRDTGVSNLVFNGADVVPDPTLPDDRIKFINENHRADPALSGELSFA